MGVILFIVMAMMTLSGASMAAVHQVGDSTGWTIVGSPDYNKWASNRTFHVGDTLIFSYHKQYHTVEEVSHYDYTMCNTSSPKSIYHSGLDSINLTRPGDYYYICGSDGHCLAGQKLHIKAHLSSISPLVTTTGTNLTTSHHKLSSYVAANDPHPSTNNAAITGSSSVTAAAVIALGTLLV